MRKVAKKGDLVVVYWSDICESANLATADAEVLVRETAMFYMGGKWQKLGGKRQRVEVFFPTKDAPDVIDSAGYLAIPASNVLALRVVETRGDGETAYSTWAMGGGSGGGEGAA